MGLTVTGGIGGIDACLEDLAAITTVLLATSSTVTEAAHYAQFVRLEIGGCSGLDLGAANAQLEEILASLSRPAHDALHEAHKLRDLAAVVGLAAEYYHRADNDVATLFSHALLALPGAVARSTVSLAKDGPLSALQSFATSEPDLINLLASATLGAHLPAAARRWVADGNPVVTDGLNDVAPTAVRAPHSTMDLMTELAARNDGESGEISVSFVFGKGGTQHVIVDIPGTKSWSPLQTDDITSLATNVRAIEGGQTSYEKGVLQAMAQAGVTPQDDVMLIGHSEGGMVAVATARDSVGQFHISHVVTAGAPIGRFVGQLPSTVQVLALEGRHDIAPTLDGRSNPDRVNVVTVTGGRDHHSIGENHHLEDEYEPLAAQVDASSDPSIRQYKDGIHDFLDQNYMRTEKFVITREY